MQPVLTAAEMGALDRFTIETLGLDGKLLMSSAAREVLRVLRERFPRARRPLIFAGVGNNGGDGVALALYAQHAGLSPTLVLCHPEIAEPPQLSPDSAYFLAIARQSYVPVRLLGNPALAPEVLTNEQCEIVVDALFGTGLDRPLGEYYTALIERLNLSSCPRLAVDCPSGLNCTTGEVLGAAVAAQLTVTMGYPKRGFFHPRAWRYTGEVVSVPIGFAPLLDAALTPGAQAWGDVLWEPLRTARVADTHKGDYGKLLVVAGHREYPGAPRLVARAAMRSGAGLVRLVVPEPIYGVCCDDPSLMVSAHPAASDGGFPAEPSETLLNWQDWADALVIGPGLGDSLSAQMLVRALLGRRDMPTVVDADGLRALGNTWAPPAEREWPLVLTPHVGELARLQALAPQQALDEWFELVSHAAVERQALLLAKSNQCVIGMPNGSLIFPARGHPALASGGTGDVLSGIIGALLARLAVHAPELAAERIHAQSEVVASAVNIHAAAARAGVERWGENGLTATDLADLVPEGIRRLAGV